MYRVNKVMWPHSSPRRRWAWLGIFGLCVAVAGAASLLIGKDVNWDLRNYHYYNAFAFLNGRFGWDLAPAQIQTYFNPLGDFPFYALVNVMPGPRSVAFAMALALQQRGVFTWGEWAAALGEEIKRAQRAGDPDIGDTYYRHWLATLERLVTEKGVTSEEALGRYRDAWDRAADRTPHGAPIELKPDDFSRPEP